MIHYMTTQGVGDAWVGNELRIVLRDDIPVRLHALRRPASTYFTSPDIARLGAETNVLYDAGVPAVIAAFLAAPLRFGARFWSALGEALTGPRESLRVRAVAFWHLMLACHWAAGLRGQPVSHIHSQWIHSGGTVAMYGAWLLDRPYSFTGHAADLFRNRAALTTKIRRAEFIICISEFHRQFFLEHGARPDQLFVVHCGIDTSHFAPNRRIRPDGAPFHVLSSGRLVGKKGFPVLIEAIRLLREAGEDVTCTIAGSGPDEAALRTQIAGAGLNDVVTLTGEALKQEDIPAFMATGDVYALPCVWAADNDVDGLPQMLMEAMACGLPAVSTRLVGIPDLIRDGETGLLVAPEDAPALSAALLRLRDDADLATRLAGAGRAIVEADFDINTCLEPLISRYRDALETRT